MCVLFIFRIIKKDQFKEMKNDHLELEPFVECQDCGRKLHQICVLHMENIWPQGWAILPKLIVQLRCKPVEVQASVIILLLFSVNIELKMCGKLATSIIVAANSQPTWSTYLIAYSKYSLPILLKVKLPLFILFIYLK